MSPGREFSPITMPLYTSCKLKQCQPALPVTSRRTRMHACATETTGDKHEERRVARQEAIGGRGGQGREKIRQHAQSSKYFQAQPKTQPETTKPKEVQRKQDAVSAKLARESLDYQRSGNGRQNKSQSRKNQTGLESTDTTKHSKHAKRNPAPLR